MRGGESERGEVNEKFRGRRSRGEGGQRERAGQGRVERGGGGGCLPFITAGYPLMESSCPHLSTVLSATPRCAPR